MLYSQEAGSTCRDGAASITLLAATPPSLAESLHRGNGRATTDAYHKSVGESSRTAGGPAPAATRTPDARCRRHRRLRASAAEVCRRRERVPGGRGPAHTLPASWCWPAPGGWRDWATATLSGADSGGAQGWTMPGIRVAGPGPWHGRAQCLSIVAHRRRRVPGRRNPRAEE